MVLALCTPADILSMYRVLFNSLLYFQRYAQDKLNIAKNRKGGNSVNTGNRVMVLEYAIPLMALYHCIKFHLIIFNSFRDMLQKILSLQNWEGK